MAVRRIVLTLMAITAVAGWAAIELLIGIVQLLADIARLI
jgi:hypothetical protein